MVIDELARLEGIDLRKLEKSAAVGKAEVCGRTVSSPGPPHASRLHM